MPSSYFVYTIIFSRTQNSVRFIEFQKRAKAYFFHTRGGRVYQRGTPFDLHGATKFALPGGGFEGDDWDDDNEVYQNCEREFTEECGRLISFINGDEIASDDDDDEVIDAEVFLKRWPVNIQAQPEIAGYAAMYVKVPDNQLEVVRDYIAECFAQRDRAVGQIVNRRIREYDQIAQRFPMAPMDDELDLAEPAIREIRQGDFNNQWIQDLSGDSDTNWFSEIIKALETIDG